MTDGPASFDHADFPVPGLVAAKRGRRVSVCIPARNEERTLGLVLTRGLAPLGPGGAGLVDQVVVVDDGSTDGTAAVAERGNAAVVRRRGPGGKGQAMAAGFEATDGDVIAFLDADVENTTTVFVTGLLGPLLTSEEFVLVKGFYQRPLHGEPTGGGRVTELVARPIIDLLFPELAAVRQPLAGETAGHRWLFEKVGFAPDYGVELALLVDTARRFGVSAIAQVDLGVRVHRNRPLHELRPQARDVLRAALARAGLPGDGGRRREGGATDAP